MIKAAAPSTMTESLIPLLEGDIIIDGGNSHFPDTMRRTVYIESKGLVYRHGRFGGEEGAPKVEHDAGRLAGSVEQRKAHIQAILKVEDGSPAATGRREFGAGHFVKMAHNGINTATCSLYAVLPAHARHSA